MKLFVFRSKPKKSPFAPEWNYIMFESMIDDIDFDKISSVILKKEIELQNQYPSDKIKSMINKPDVDGYVGLNHNSMTSRYHFYNVFSWQNYEIQLLKNKILEIYFVFLDSIKVKREKTWIQCWANVMRTGEQIKPHLHSTCPYTYLGGHVTIQCENSSTFYINPINQLNDPETHESKNEIGKLTFFQNNIPHYTSVHNGQKERITIAFNIIVDEDYQRRPNKEVYVLFDEGEV